jgi:hypothetical protein
MAILSSTLSVGDSWYNHFPIFGGGRVLLESIVSTIPHVVTWSTWIEGSNYNFILFLELSWSELAKSDFLLYERKDSLYKEELSLHCNGC